MVETFSNKTSDLNLFSRLQPAKGVFLGMVTDTYLQLSPQDIVFKKIICEGINAKC